MLAADYHWKPILDAKKIADSGVNDATKRLTQNATFTLLRLSPSAVCGPGSVRDALIPGGARCRVLARGYYSHRYNSTRCDECPADHVTEEIGATAPALCGQSVH